MRTSPRLSNLAFRVFVMLVAYRLLEEVLESATRLPHEAYEHSLILWQCVQYNLPVVLLLITAPFVVLISPKLRRGWALVPNRRATRLLVIASAATLAWGFSTYNYNHYFDQAHLWDRGLLVALVVACWIHPAFVFPFLLQLMSIAAQFHHPIGHFSWTDKFPLVRVLILFGASLITLQIWRRRVGRDFALAVSCLIAAHYFIPGWAKVELGWWKYNHVDHLTAGALANGWLHFLDGDSTARVLAFLRSQNQLGIWLTLLVEVGAILLLVHRRVAAGIVCGWILLHVAILLASGICFWKWIALDASFLLYLARSPEVLRQWLFSPPRFAMSVVLIAFGSLLFSPVKLGWYDTAVSYTFDFVGRGQSGSYYAITKEALAPYDFFFSQNRLSFLTHRRKLTDTYGTTGNYSIVQALHPPPREIAEIVQLESRLGRSKYDANKSARCDQFFSRFFSTWNRRLDRTNSSPLRAPLHIWSQDPSTGYHGQEPLTMVQIHLTTWVHDQRRKPTPVSKELLREITLEPFEVRIAQEHTDYYR